MVKTAFEHMNAAIAEIEAKVVEGHISEQDAVDAIARMRQVHSALNRLEAKLGRPAREGDDTILE